MYNNFTPAKEEEVTKPDGSITGERLQIGSGGRGLRADERGMWLGNESSADSPFHVDMDGNIHVRNTPDGGGNLIFYDEEGVARIFIGFEE